MVRVTFAPLYSSLEHCLKSTQSAFCRAQVLGCTLAAAAQPHGAAHRFSPPAAALRGLLLWSTRNFL